MIVPVITLYQPWATWIMNDWKTIETRVHARFESLRNTTILIHAGQKTDDSDFVINNPYLMPNQIKADDLINGHILGSAYVYDTKWLTDSHSEAALIDCKNTKRFGLFLSGVNKFKIPIPAKGSMGIWYFDTEKLEKVKKPEQIEKYCALKFDL